MKKLTLIFAFIFFSQISQADRPPIEEVGPTTISHRRAMTIGPGIEIGQSSQTATLSFGGHGMFEFDGENARQTWRAMNLKLTLTRKDNETAAYGGFITFGGGAKRTKWLGGGFEFGAGVVGKDSNRFGVVQLGYMLGLPTCLQVGVLTQAPVYTAVKPDWFTDLNLVLRWNFGVHAKPGQTFKAVQPEG